MHQKSMTGFILERLPLTDHSFVVTLFSKQDGLVKGVYRAPRGKHFSQSHLNPLNEITFQFGGKQHQSLKRISGDAVVRQTGSVCQRFEGLCMLQHWGFLLAQSQPEWERDDRVYRLIDHCLTWALDTDDVARYPIANFFFEIWLLHLCGMFPRITAATQAEVTFENGRLTYRGEPLVAGQKTWDTSDLELLITVFKTKIGQFVSIALEWKSLTRLSASLGDLWSQYLNRSMKARAMFFKCFDEEGFA